MSIRELIFTALLLGAGCNRMDYQWHKGGHTEARVSAPPESGLQNVVSVASHRWKVIGPSDDKRETYEWGWEVTIAAGNEANSQTNANPHLKPCFFVNKIRYSLLDKDGFELLTDDRAATESMIYNSTNTIRHSALLNKFQAARAFCSRVLVELDVQPPDGWL